MSNSILGTGCDDESQAVIKQSCANTSLFLCGLLGIVCLCLRPVFMEQKKSPNKIRSHLDRKCLDLSPGIRRAENLYILLILYKKRDVTLTSLLNPTPKVYCTSLQCCREEIKIYDIVLSL